MSGEIAIEGIYWELFDKTEWVSIVTSDGKTPHLVANWGDYLRAFGILEGNTLLMPAGRYHKTEENLRRDPAVQLLMASRQVSGSQSAGQGCLLVGEGEVQSQVNVPPNPSSPQRPCLGCLVHE